MSMGLRQVSSEFCGLDLLIDYSPNDMECHGTQNESLVNYLMTVKVH